MNQVQYWIEPGEDENHVNIVADAELNGKPFRMAVVFPLNQKFDHLDKSLAAIFAGMHFSIRQQITANG